MEQIGITKQGAEPWKNGPRTGVFDQEERIWQSYFYVGSICNFPFL